MGVRRRERQRPAPSCSSAWWRCSAGVMTSFYGYYFWPTTGDGFLLNTIASVFLGGTSVFGGTGSIVGSFVAAYIIGAINAGHRLGRHQRLLYAALLRTGDRASRWFSRRSSNAASVASRSPGAESARHEDHRHQELRGQCEAAELDLRPRRDRRPRPLRPGRSHARVPDPRRGRRHRGSGPADPRRGSRSTSSISGR